jgi:uncharacterized protein
MNAVLTRLAAAVERAPAIALALLVVLTLVLGAFASQQETETDLTMFAPRGELADAHARIVEEFGAASSSIQVIVDAGPDGDILTVAGLQVADQVTDVVRSTPEVVAVLAEGTPEMPPVVTYAMPFLGAIAESGQSLDNLDDQGLADLVAAMFADPSAVVQAGGLLSDDLAPETATARAGLVIIRLDGDVTADDHNDAELALRDALAEASFDGVTVTPFGEYIFADALVRDMEEEMPRLLGFAFLLIILILFVTYRRIGDVLLGLAGLLITIMWTFGFAVLMGPSYLGITGPMSQISIMIPVLLIGLAIDYAIHLTSRYREELAADVAPPAAARRAVMSVGGALVLATITTAVGFLTNVVSPLAPIRDFGLFVAAGVVSAFIVMLLLVPSARSLIDRRRIRRGTLKPAPVGTERGLGKVMVRAAVLAERHPIVTLGVAGVVTLTAAVAGLQVSTEFSQNDFIPEGSDVEATIATMQELFGGDLDETTNLLVEGDLTTPDAANAMAASAARMDDTPYVRTTGGQAQVTSPVSVVAMLAADPDLGTQLSSLGYRDGAFAADADVDAIWGLARQAAPTQLDAVLNADATAGRLVLATTASQDNARDLRDDLVQDAAPLDQAGLQVVVVSDFLLFEEALDALTASQTRGIGITLLVALMVLVGYFTLRDRRPLLGLITMIPSALVVAWVAGSMWVLGLSFNVMTAMVASLAIGIGVPYGIHITNRFSEDLERAPSVDEAVRETVVHTGGALVGSATTTAAGFGVLAFASLMPMQQFGIITALTIIYSLIAAVLIEPACLKLWADRRWSGPSPEPTDDVVQESGVWVAREPA